MKPPTAQELELIAEQITSDLQSDGFFAVLGRAYVKQRIKRRLEDFSTEVFVRPMHSSLEALNLRYAENLVAWFIKHWPDINTAGIYDRHIALDNAEKYQASRETK